MLRNLFKKNEPTNQMPTGYTQQQLVDVLPNDGTIQTKKIYVAGVHYNEPAFNNLRIPNANYKLTKKQIIDAGMIDLQIPQYVYKQVPLSLAIETAGEFIGAVQVIIDGNFVGYVPSDESDHIRELIQTKRIISIKSEISGGKLKGVAKNKELLHFETNPQIKLFIAYRW